MLRRLLLLVLVTCAPVFAGLMTISRGPLTVSDSDWQLPAGNYQQSGLTFELYYPPASASVWAYHLRAPAGYDRVVPFAIAGGCPPYHLTLNEGPPGASVYNPYMVGTDPPTLTIPDVTVGEWDVDVTIQDQCASTPLNPTWSFEGIDADNSTYFVYVDAAAGGGGDGSESSPFDSLADVLGPNNAATTWQGRQLIVCGSHIMSGLAVSYANNGERLRVSATKPYVWVACPGGATLLGSAANTSDGSFFSPEGTVDLAVVGFGWDNPLTDETSGALGLKNRHAAMGGANSLFFDNTFDCTSTADDTGSNPAAIFVTNENGGAVIGNTFSNCDHMMPVMVYITDKLAIQHNILTGNDNTEGIFLKAGTEITNISVTFNVSTGGSAPFSTIQSINDTPPWIRGPIDYMHNRHVSTGTCLRLVGAEPTVYDVTSKRNNWKCDFHSLNTSSNNSGTISLEYDVLEHDGSQTTPNPGIDETGVGVDIEPANNDVATSGLLDDTTGLQDAGDCTKGAEICTSQLLEQLDAANDDTFEVRLVA